MKFMTTSLEVDLILENEYMQFVRTLTAERV